jgi:hypothetical protein
MVVLEVVLVLVLVAGCLCWCWRECFICSAASSVSWFFGVYG